MKNIFLTLVSIFLINIAWSQIENLPNGSPNGSDEEFRPLPTIEIKQDYTIKSGDTVIIPLPRFTYVDRIMLDVRNNFFCKSSKFRMSFDGSNLQSVEVSGGAKGFRSKILTVNNSARNIEIYNETDCKIVVKNITVLPRRINAGYSSGAANISDSESVAHVSFLLETMRYLEELVSDQDKVEHISPAKKALGKALSALNTLPATAQASRTVILEVLTQFTKSQSFIERLLSINATYDIAQEIQSTLFILERMIR